jgi:predicted nucleic acid-binding protein
MVYQTQGPSRRATGRTSIWVAEDEVLALIEHHRLMGIGIGWIDAHLLASAMLGGIGLWTLDRRLAEAALRLSHNQ